MSVDKCKIHFNPDNLDIVVERGTNLLTAALAAGVHIRCLLRRPGHLCQLQSQNRIRFCKKYSY